MPTYKLLIWLLNTTWVFFIFAYGACLGSLANVVVYRMPKGLSVITPPSRCPRCETKLAWKDNIPVLGWIMLKGKCRYCGNKISPEYPIVEASVGLLFVLFFAIWYLVPQLPYDAAIWGYKLHSITPRWAALNPPAKTWPEFVLLLVLLASLVTMTIVDAKTFTIPHGIAEVPLVLAFIVHPVHAAWLTRAGQNLPRAAPDWTWAIPTPWLIRWDLVGLTLGGMLGIGVGWLLLKSRLISRSFDDFPEWEAKANAAAQQAGPGLSPSPDPAGATSGEPVSDLTPASPPAPAPTTIPEVSNPEVWMYYPFARREMVKELAFLAPCVLLMLAGYYAGWHYGGMNINPDTGFYTATDQVPFWLTVLSGVAMGYLVGGGIVWFVRIAGTLGFGKEAMGMGDVHMMAAVGACVGWIDATIGFLGAAFVGLGWWVLGRLAGGKFTRMLPYGPFLAISTVLVLVFKPLVQEGLSLLLGHPISIP